MTDKEKENLVPQELVSETALKKALLFSQIFSMIAIPVVLALIGYWVQRSVQDQQIKRDYVNLAISLLIPKKEGEAQTTPELTNWAIKLLNDSAPVKLSEPEIISVKRDGLRPGDLLFFSTNKGKVNHASIYLGDGIFSRSSDREIKIDDLKLPENFNYRTTYKGN
ncbi:MULTISPECIES: NlpC/P60 family protein [Pseudomonas]|uniref:NlpC/P60 family protein n=1 Tax=Pseudomonas TaxID=286 RepID=UPI000930FF67|nr:MULTISPECIES: NlpC/P60 family protein [Pseudomonas]NHN69933.1 C40 family peptidase [Pseudomonas fluorescens]